MYDKLLIYLSVTWFNISIQRFAIVVRTTEMNEKTIVFGSGKVE
jgi:nitrogenase molybdenum-iron protein alpha/beta subunit